MPARTSSRRRSAVHAVAAAAVALGLICTANRGALFAQEGPTGFSPTVPRLKLPGPSRPPAPPPVPVLDLPTIAQQDERGAVPLNGLMQARAHMDAMPTAGGVAGAGATGGAWTSIGPGNIGGRIRALAIHPTAPDTIVAGATPGGIWKTTDGGAHWAPVADFLASLSVSCIIYRPGDPSVLFAGTGEGYYDSDSVQGAGIFKSNDGGTTWTQLASTTTTDFLYVNRLAMSADGAVVLAATRTGVFRSANLGVSWSRMFTPGSSDMYDVKFLPKSSTNALAAGRFSHAYFSSDGGLTWTAAAVGDLGWDNRFEIGLSASAPLTVYMANYYSTYLAETPSCYYVEVLKSLDGGQSFTHRTSIGGCFPFGNSNAIWVDPTNADTIIVGNRDVFRSTTGGDGLMELLGSVDGAAFHEFRTIVSGPGFNGTDNRRLYMGTDEGIYRVNDAYAPPASFAFESLNHGLATSAFYGGSGNPSTGAIVGGARFNGFMFSPPSAGSEGWIPEAQGRGGVAVIDPTDANYVYGDAGFLHILRATNGLGPATDDVSGCFKSAPYKLGACDGAFTLGAPFLLDPNNPSRLWVGGSTLFRTDNARAPVTSSTGPAWTTLPSSGHGWISAIAVTPGNSDAVWIGFTSGEMYRTVNATGVAPTWIRVDTGAPGLPARMITSLAFDPSNTNVLYAAYGGFSGDNLWRTSTNGATWTDVTGSGASGLPDLPLHSVVVHPIHSNWLYVGAELGVFASADGGAHWSAPNGGPANVPVSQLFWMGTTLTAATFGRGMFTTPVPPIAIGLSPGALAFGATKNGSGGNLVAVTPAQPVRATFTNLAPAWTATADQPWLQIANGSGVGAGTFSVSIVNPANVIGGATTLSGTVTVSALGVSQILPVTLTVQQTAGASGPAFGLIDTPVQNASGVVGAIGFTGWALDDVGVATVKIYRNCLGFENPASCQIVGGQNVVFVGAAAFLQDARPDVEAAFPGVPQASRAGWGFQVLTNTLPHIPSTQPSGGQGTFLFYPYATDVEGHVTLLGRTPTDHTPTAIAVDNDHIAKPFGTMDTPSLGGTVNGTLANFGWVLTPDADATSGNGDITIPADGSTIWVFVDGIALGTAIYNQCRGTVGSPVPGGQYCNDDIANAFGANPPQAPLTPRSSNPTRYRNLDAASGAIGLRLIDTTTLTNGLHTIAWGVTDSNGRVEGIGSRFFQVLNGGGGSFDDAVVVLTDREGPSTAQNSLVNPSRAVMARSTFDVTRPFAALQPDADGIRHVEISAMGRLEVSLGGPVAAGYLLNGDDLRPLPVGSHLDTRAGIFTWSPPAGYLGAYRLAFLSAGERTVVTVVVVSSR